MDQQANKSILKYFKMALFILGIVFVLFLAVKISVYIVPFIIAFAISTIIEPIIRFLVVKARFNRKLASAITLLLFLGTFGFLLSLAISKLISEIIALSNVMPKYISDMYYNISTLIDESGNFFSALPFDLSSNISGLVSSVSRTIADTVSSFAKSVVNTAISIPEALIFTIVTLLSTYFFTSDRERIFKYFELHLPDSWTKKLAIVKGDLFSALFGYIRAQLILMTITFTELFTGLTIIGIRYSLVLAVTIAIIDAFPILGTGGVLIPWALYELLLGETRLGVSLFILYLIVLVVRQLTEPKVLSQQIGLHPLVTLTAMYAGLKMFGVTGLIFAPITTLVIKNILSGVIKSGMIKDFLNKIRPPIDN